MSVDNFQSLNRFQYQTSIFTPVIKALGDSIYRSFKKSILVLIFTENILLIDQ